MIISQSLMTDLYVAIKIKSSASFSRKTLPSHSPSTEKSAFTFAAQIKSFCDKPLIACVLY
jgi:hypothetical protein